MASRSPAEPTGANARSGERLGKNQSPQLGFKWRSLLIGVVVLAFGGVTLLVLEGRAKSTLSNPHPSPDASSVAVKADGENVDTKPRQPLVAAVPADAKLETLSREQLIVEVKRLRSENADLSQRNKDPQKKREDSEQRARPRMENFYRVDPDELRARAERGEVHLHLPHTSGGAPLYDSKVANDLGLQPNEEASIRDIYARSELRLHQGLASLYVGIGVDANVANSLEPNLLLSELQHKTLQRDQEAAAISASRERAGLEQPSNPAEGSALLRAYRLFYREEDRVLDELDALLGRDRAERFVNHGLRGSYSIYRAK